MRNALRLVLDRQSNQLIVAPPQSPLPALGEGAGVGAAAKSGIDAQCRKAHHDAFTKARQNGKSFPIAWAMADEAARGLREQISFTKGQVNPA